MNIPSGRLLIHVPFEELSIELKVRSPIHGDGSIETITNVPEEGVNNPTRIKRVSIKWNNGKVSEYPHYLFGQIRVK